MRILTILLLFQFAGSVAKHLFNTNAVTDFLTNVFFCPVVLRYMLDPYLYPLIRRGTSIDVLITIYFNLIVASSIVTSTALAICRYIRIKFPFYAIKRMRVFICGLVTVATQLGLIISYSFVKKDFKVIWVRYSIQALNLSNETSILKKYLILTRVVIVAVIVSMGIVVSVLSVLELRKSSKVANSSQLNIAKSSKVIVCMNIYNTICVIGLAVSATNLCRYPVIFFLSNTGSSIIGAAFNPTIRVMASKDVYKYCKSLLLSEH